MKQRILLFAGVRSASGLDHIDIDVDDDATAQVVLDELERQLPDSGGLIRISRLAIDGRYVGNDEQVGHCSGEFALIPPVSGG
ncbi:MAG: MoaD/ThiS family protein [Planctomycetota bacterium]